jgi:hypothetical protein
VLVLDADLQRRIDIFVAQRLVDGDLDRTVGLTLGNRAGFDGQPVDLLGRAIDDNFAANSPG